MTSTHPHHSHLRAAISAAKRRRGRHPRPHLAEKLADAVANTVGSWRFIVIQSLVLTAWIIGNAIAGQSAWDPYPFILLNLMLSFQAAYTAPIIMMSQNRQADIDRDRARADYEVNIRAEAEIRHLHEKVDMLRERHIEELTVLLREALARLDAERRRD